MTIFLCIAVGAALLVGWIALMVWLADEDRGWLAGLVLVIGIGLLGTAFYYTTRDEPPCARYEKRLMPVGRTVVLMRHCVERWEPVP